MCAPIRAVALSVTVLCVNWCEESVFIAAACYVSAVCARQMTAR